MLAQLKKEFGTKSFGMVQIILRNLKITQADLERLESKGLLVKDPPFHWRIP